MRLVLRPEPVDNPSVASRLNLAKNRRRWGVNRRVRMDRCQGQR